MLLLCRCFSQRAGSREWVPLSTHSLLLLLLLRLLLLQACSGLLLPTRWQAPSGRAS